MGMTVTIGIASLIQLLFMAGMLIYHYSRTEAKNEERYKYMKDGLDNHENRLSILEQAKTQGNGQSTYIPRNECLRERERISKRVGDMEKRVSDHDTQLAVIERGEGRRVESRQIKNGRNNIASDENKNS